VDKHFHVTKDEFELYALDRLADSEFIRLEEHFDSMCHVPPQLRRDRRLCVRHAGGAHGGCRSGRHAGWLRRPGIPWPFGLIMLIGVMVVLSRKPVELLPSATLNLPASSGEGDRSPDARTGRDCE